MFSATREHEVGIASNRKTARYGEYTSRPSTHRPSRHGNYVIASKYKQLFKINVSLLFVGVFFFFNLRLFYQYGSSN